MNISNIVTHNARFHSDDVFACATLSLIYPEAKITRTREQELITNADLVLDVGGIYDLEKNRFDHHQPEGAGKRENGVPYASFGLIWKHFGRQLVESEDSWRKIDEKLVQAIDVLDTMEGGMDLVAPKSDLMHPYFIQFAMSSFNPTWKEDESDLDKRFLEAVSFAKRILQREIIWANDVATAEGSVLDLYNKRENKNILILDDDYPWQEFTEYLPDITFVVRPDMQTQNWKVETIRDNKYSYVARKDLPKTWGGLTKEALADVSGVPDAVFCHRALFMAVAGSKEGAISLANKALES